MGAAKNMSKKVLKLDFTNDFDFPLIGIICGYKDFRLVFDLNYHLGFDFKRGNDVVVPAGKPGSSTRHSYYKHLGSDDEVYHIISNRDKDLTGYFIPEQKNIDYYFLVSQTNGRLDEKVLVKTIRQIDIIAGTYEIDPNELKSAEAFLIFMEA